MLAGLKELIARCWSSWCKDIYCEQS